jgi:hypothetical protein
VSLVIIAYRHADLHRRRQHIGIAPVQMTPDAAMEKESYLWVL